MSKFKPTESTPSGSASPQRPQMRIDESQLETTYANFCRVTGTPEELIIDFGLNTQPYSPANEPMVVSQRIVTNYYTAKRMLHFLQLTVQRHEATFGPIEMDVQKRILPEARKAG